MKRLAGLSVLPAIVLGLLAIAAQPTSVWAQCCGRVCVDADEDGFADDHVGCSDLVLSGVTSVTLTGCNDVPSVACVGGQVLLGGEVLNGCGCLLGNCADGGLNTLTSGECTAAAVQGCIDGGNTVEDLDSDACPACGNGVCTSSENLDSCPEDCAECGDGICSALVEDAASCPEDCGPVCGDGVCEPGEDRASCPQDCGPVCGDGVCEPGEDDGTCGPDCGCAAHVCGSVAVNGLAPAGCACDSFNDCSHRGDCCADVCDVCGSPGCP